MTYTNLVVFICDSLRYDFTPLLVKYLGIDFKRIKIIKAISPATSTPAAIASIITALEPLHHNVRYFTDKLDPTIDTVFKYFSNYEFYDYPLDPVRRVILGLKSKPKELAEMNEPFIWIERIMETHVPYGIIHHGNSVSEGVINEYLKLLRRGKINFYKEYKKGVIEAAKHIRKHINELNELKLADRTLIVITADHGETSLGQHMFPYGLELVLVPVIFIFNNPTDKVRIRMPNIIRLVDVLPTALEILGLSWPNRRSVIGKSLNVIYALNVAYEHIPVIWEITCSNCSIKDVIYQNNVYRMLGKFFIKLALTKEFAPILVKIKEKHMRKFSSLIKRLRLKSMEKDVRSKLRIKLRRLRKRLVEKAHE